MNRCLYIAGFICFFINAGVLAAQEPARANGEIREINQTGRRRIVVLDIDVRVLENETTVSWSSSVQKTTIPGSPVGLQLNGANIVISAQFTPFIRRNGNVLVAQGQVWINDTDNAIGYYTSIQTIPMELNEPIHFFPLGQTKEGVSSSLIEIIVTTKLYRESSPAETTDTDNDN